MLGDVARWLRILGEDAAWVPPEWRDEELVEAATRDGRVLVTRDAHLVDRARRHGLNALLVPQAVPEVVLEAVYRATSLVPEERLLATRCASCNGPLVTVPGNEAAARAVARGKDPPLPAVQERHDEFWSCMECGQAFWRGTHWEAITATRRALLARLRP
jgi:uncharacterized protein